MLCFRRANDDGYLTNQNDTSAQIIGELQDAINDAVCELANNTHFGDYSPTEGEEFDFIVVGAGSAGAVMANRLSENPSWRVLLLEAGGDPTLSSEVPYFTGSLQNSSIAWGYSSEPEPTNCLGYTNRKCALPQGKVLGGSSTINSIGYVRGLPEDYNRWEEMGNPGWGFKDMLTYFKKSEDMRSETILSKPNASDYQGCRWTFKNRVLSKRHASCESDIRRK